MADLSINQYVSNPLGKGSSASSLKIIKTEYDARYDALLDMYDEFQTHIYRNKNAYYIHLLIPSETTKDLSYDVVLKIDRASATKESNYINWAMKAISNSPAFAFTFANTFKRNGTLIEELKSIIPSQTVKEFAEIRNPHKLPGVDKSIYYACKYIKESYSNIDEIDKFASDLDLKKLIKELRDFSEIMKAKDIDQKKKAEEKKEQKAQEKKELNEKLHNREHVIGKITTKSNSKTSIKAATAKKASKAKKAKRI
jgi:hypothetical protein